MSYYVRELTTRKYRGKPPAQIRRSNGPDFDARPEPTPEQQAQSFPTHRERGTHRCHVRGRDDTHSRHPTAHGVPSGGVDLGGGHG